MLRARAQQENVAAARKAAQANRLDEAARLYEQAIAASPDSAFLVRDLAEVEAKQGKTDQALARYRRVVEMDPTDAASRIRIGEILDARGDLAGAMKMYTEANNLEPSAELRRRMAAIDARLAYLKLPAEYRAIPNSCVDHARRSRVAHRHQAGGAARARTRSARRHHRRAQPLGVGVDHGRRRAPA